MRSDKRTPIIVLETGASFEEMEAARFIVSRLNRTKYFPPSMQLRVKASGPIAEGAEVASAHASWIRERVDEIGGLASLPQQPADAKCPAGLHLLEVECIRRFSGGMSSYYGFEGTFVSLLVDLEREKVFDARAEAAT